MRARLVTRRAESELIGKAYTRFPLAPTLAALAARLSRLCKPNHEL